MNVVVRRDSQVGTLNRAEDVDHAADRIESLVHDYITDTGAVAVVASNHENPLRESDDGSCSLHYSRSA